MPYYQKNAYTTTGTKGSIGLDPSIVPFNVAINCTVGITATYKLQYTLNPLDSPAAVDTDAIWVDSADIPAGTTISQQVAFVTPVARVRLVIAAISGTLTIETSQGLSTN